MFKKVLFAAALVVASSPAFVSAQDDVFFSFSDSALVTNASQDTGTAGTAYIFSTVGFDFDAIDISFAATSTNGATVDFTGGTAFDPELAVFGGSRYNRAESVPGSGVFDTTTSIVEIIPATAADPAVQRLVGVNVTQNGVTATGATLIGGVAIDETFRGDASFGATGAFLLGEVDFDLVGLSNDSTAEFSLFFDPDGLGIADTDGNNFRDTATLGSASLTVSGVVDVDPGTPVVPEPSSAVLLMLGAAGMVARRRRS